MTREDLFNALVAAKNGISGEPLYSEAEARKIVDDMSDEHIEHISSKYESADEWVDYYTM